MSKGRHARNKGASGERELADILSAALGVKVKRKLGQAREGGDDMQVEHFRIEAKRREAINIHAWCQQVEAVAKQGEVPVVMFRRNRDAWRVCLLLDDFIPMMKGVLKNESVFD